MNDFRHTNFDWNIIETTCDNILHKPLQIKEIIKVTSNNTPHVEGNIVLTLGDMGIIAEKLDDFFNLLSRKLVGDLCLTNISYRPIDVTSNGDIIMYVSGVYEKNFLTEIGLRNKQNALEARIDYAKRRYESELENKEETK